MEYVLSPGGQCKYMYLDPADAHHLVDCMWRFEAGQPPKIHIQSGPSFSIVTLQEDLLRMRPTE
jgi:hypothetical protein